MGKGVFEKVLGRNGKDGAKTRRTELRRRIVEGSRASWRERLLRPEVASAAIMVALYVACATFVANTFRDTLLISPGRIVDHTRTVRTAFEVEDREKTERERDRLRWQSPRLYSLDAGYIEELGVALESLPTTLATAETFEQVAPQIIEQFELTPARFVAVRAYADTTAGPTMAPGTTGTWTRSVATLLDLLGTTPLVSSEEFQLLMQEGQKQLEVVKAGEQPRLVPRRLAINIGSADQPLPEGTSTELLELAKRAGFGGEGAAVVAARLAWNRKSTCTFDREATAKRESEATASVKTVLIPYKEGDVLYRAGDTLTERQRALAMVEREAFESSVPLVAWVLRGGSMAVLVMILTLAVGGYCRFFYGEHFERWWQWGRLGLASLAMLGASCWGAMSVPSMVWLVALAPTVLLSLVVLVAYDTRVALMVTGAQATLVSVVLGLGAGFVAVSLVGSMVANWRLSEIRTRTDMVLGGLSMTGILAIGVAVVSLVERPVSNGIAGEVARDALAAGLGGFIATAVAMVLLPGIERLFGVTTGMTLSELRDPKHPLLRELQQRAPGTYNHSLNVASLAEAGANAIGANGLHLYVGALYHDVGKMNKPEYFVENQPRGFNRHDKLSPAMSLLVIVGHVKDGVELARAYRLPKSLIHYIESHHGTTLVEYFFDQARRQAQESEGERPAEVEYRYPGPRPRTKEAAILMLCDAVESATRAMPDPTPGRIQALVHLISRKRLTDGQFDESGLTLRELSMVEDAVSKTLAAVYHGRLAYPKIDPAPEEMDAMAARADRVAAEQAS